MSKFKFGASLLGLPENLYDLFENSVSKSRVTNKIVFQDFIQSKMVNGKMVVVRKEKFLLECNPENQVFTGFGLNMLLDIISGGYDYIGLINGKHVLYRASFQIDPEQIVISGDDGYVPENFIYISETLNGEEIYYEVNELERMKEVVKLPTGEWILKKEWTEEELLSLKFKAKELPKFITPTAYNKLPNITKEKLYDSMDVKTNLENSTDPDLIRHMFTAIGEFEPGVLTSEIFINGKTNEERDFSTYKSSANLLNNWNSFDCSWALYNDYPIPANPTDANEIGNFGMVHRVYASKNDINAKQINIVADGQRKYDSVTHTFHYDPSKPVFFQFRTNHFPKNGKEMRHECYYNPITKKFSYNMFDM